MTPELYEAVRAELAARPGLTARDLVSRLRRGGFAVSKRDLNPLLSDDSVFVSRPGMRSRWSLDAVNGHPTRAAETPPATPAGIPRGLLRLHAWQSQALQQWNQAGQTGVVEAVAGGGKSQVGLAAIRQEAAVGGRSLVLVSTVERVREWRARCEAHLPELSLNCLGDGAGPTGDENVLIAVGHRAAAAGRRKLAGVTLVVVEDCYRYGAPGLAKALREEFGKRLGLAEPLESADADGPEKLRRDYFGEVVYRYDYPRAARDKLLEPFSVDLVGVELAAAEKAQYTRLCGQVDAAFGTLRPALRSDRPELEQIVRLAEGDPSGAITASARAYLKLRQDRLELLARSSGKPAALTRLAGRLKGRRGLVVCDESAAESVTKALAGAGLRVAALNPGLDGQRRRDVLSAFAGDELDALCVPWSWDVGDGSDGARMPRAEVAIMLAVSATSGQLTRLLGRVLRAKADGAPTGPRGARLVFVFARATAEDPAAEGHDSLLDLVLGLAQQVNRLDEMASDAVAAATQPVRRPAAEPAKAEPAKAEPAKAESAKAESAKAEPAKAESAKAESAKAESAKAEPTAEPTAPPAAQSAPRPAAKATPEPPERAERPPARAKTPALAERPGRPRLHFAPQRLNGPGRHRNPLDHDEPARTERGRWIPRHAVPEEQPSAQAGDARPSPDRGSAAQ